jgi:hypothetical protein
MQTSFHGSFAPRQNERLYINSNKILSGYLSAKPTEYSPLPQPNSSTNGFHSLFHF